MTSLMELSACSTNATDLLDCWRDPKCKAAVQCLPEIASDCSIDTLDAYLHQDLFKNSVKCLGRGLEICGRAAVGMVQDSNIASAVRCSAQCTRPPGMPPRPSPTPTPPPPRPTPAPTPWPTPAPPRSQCDVDDSDKQDCGHMTQSTCEAGGCCWHELTHGSKAPWCFQKNAMPTPAPQPTPKPPTPQPGQACDDDSACPAAQPKCVAITGLLRSVRGVMIHYLPRAVKDFIFHVPLIGNLVIGTCAKA